MWFADVVLNFRWFVDAQRQLGLPRSRATHKNDAPHPDFEFLLYGSEDEIKHLRVLILTEEQRVADESVDANISTWVNAIEIASSIASSKFVSVARFSKNSTGYMVILGQGDADAPSVIIEPTYSSLPPVDYEAAAYLMTRWKKSFRFHLFFLARFLNEDLPHEVRWLNGYRLLEWHFVGGKSTLSKNAAYRSFLDTEGSGLDRFLRVGQNRAGLVEEVRAMAAHAMLSDQKEAWARYGAPDLISGTFSILEALVTCIMNVAADDGVQFRQKTRPLE